MHTIASLGFAPLALTLAASLAASLAAAPQNPLSPPPATGNPLAPAPVEAPVEAPDPWARTFSGDKLRLVLQKRDGAYRGTLTLGDREFPVAAAAGSNGTLAGTFVSGDAEYELECTLDDDKLALRSGGAEYQLVALPSSKRTAVAPPALDGVYAGATTTWRHPEGYFTCALPKGWTVAQVTDEAVLLNPGLTDTLDAIILVSYGLLDEAERGVDVTKLLDDQEGELRQTLAAEGIELRAPQQKAKKVLVGDLPGAQQSWTGTAGGSQPVEVWFGGLVKRDYYLAVTAIAMDGKKAQFLPGAKRVFQSMQPKPPERNLALEQALQGASFFNVTNSESGAFYATYAFGPQRRVTKVLSMSGMVGLDDVNANTEDIGSFEVVGDVVYMSFRDGQNVAKAVVRERQVTGLKFGDVVYSRR